MNAHVRMHHGTPTVFLDGRPVHASFHLVGHQRHPDGLLPTQPIMRRYAGAGVHLYSTDVVSAFEVPGPAPGREAWWDFSLVEARFARFLDVDPEAHFLLRMGFEMRGAPGNWWAEAYPGECQVTSDGKAETQSLASEIWRSQVNAFLVAYIAHLRKIGLYDRVIAYQLAAGSCGEWIESGSSMLTVTPDYSEPMRRAFRDWLRRRYGGEIDALRDAWGDASASFDTAEVPPAPRQLGATRGLFRDPLKERDVVDFFACLADIASDDLLEFCRTVKGLTGREKLTGAFFGYLMEIAWNVDFFADGAKDPAVIASGEYSTYQRSGHLGLRKVLQSPDIDFLVSPYSYGFRGIGGDGLPMQPGESLRHHGKIHLMEEDTRMHNNFDPPTPATEGAPAFAGGRMHPPATTMAVYRRNVAQILTHGLGVTWMHDRDMDDFVENREPFWTLLERSERLGAWALELERAPAAEVAVLLDTESFLYQGCRNAIDLPGIFQQKLVSLNRFGAPHDVYLLDDLLEGSLPEYKLYVFLNPWRLDERRRESLARVVCRPGKTALWTYAAGFVKDDVSTGNMTGLTGFRFGRTDNAWGPFMHVTDFDHPVTRGVQQDLFWGTTAPLAPWFHLQDPDARVLGQVVGSLGRCRPGLGVKELPASGGGTWRSAWCATPNVPAPILRGVARWAGVHLYSEAGDVLYATRDLLAVHTAGGGERTFRLPRKAEVVHELLDDRPVATDVDAFSVTLPPASTSLWFVGAKSVLKKLAG
jgi:hypothetical protein